MSQNPQGEVFQGGATTSQHIDAENDDHFENTTFKLKRTRSLGLLDEFIDPEKQEEKIEQHNTDRDKTTLRPLPAQDGHASLARGSSNPLPQEDSASASPTTTTTPTPPFIRSPELIPHDDSDLVAEPSRHVDYLSYQWDVDDISKSWRYVILRRKNVANAARLENASWRTWAQRRCHLKTISPEEVNWLKESDVTWLYGPIVDDDDHDHDQEHSSDDPQTCNTASSIVAGDISIARKNHGPKPILKRRTVQDMMISHLNLLKLEIATARAEQEQKRREDAEAQRRREAKQKSGSSDRPPEYFDYDVISAKLNSQYKNYSQQSSANSSSVNLAAKNHVPPSAEDISAKLGTVASPQQDKKELTSAMVLLLLQQSLSDLTASVKEKRHIHFNDEVQQCIAIDEFSADDDEYDDYDDDDDNDYDYGDSESYIYENQQGGHDYGSEESENEAENNEEDDDDDDDEGGFFLRVRSPSSASVAGFTLPGLSSASTNKDPAKENENSEDSESISTNNSKVYKTIHLLPPTTLNYGSSDEESDDSNPYTSSMSHNVDNNSSRGYDYYYDYNTVFQVDPNHAIYGAKKTPDVVDVPENIEIGSNFDYEIIENDGINGYDNAPLEIISRNEYTPAASGATNQSDRERLPISSLEDSATQHVRPNPLSLDASDSDSDSDSDSEEQGLSISAKNSSHSLAQLVFGAHGMTVSEQQSEENHYPKEFLREKEPESGHISSINPRYSSTELSKQPHSSSSLSDQFFSTGMTKAKDNSLSELFFNTQTLTDSASPPIQSYSGTQSPPVQPKASPLPPHTTSANAFLGRSTPPLARQQSKKSFIFDSDSETEDEFIEDADPPTSSTSTDRNQTGYASLYQVADRNGITASSPDTEDSSNLKNKVGLAMANFLGSWNKGN